jgi:hypothetical protein
MSQEESMKIVTEIWLYNVACSLLDSTVHLEKLNTSCAIASLG